LVRGIHQALSHLPFNSRQGYVEANCQAVSAVSDAEVDFCVNGQVSGHCQIHFGGLGL
jgi:hypothetical protein